MSKPHKHAEVIKAWADGATIEVRNPKAVRECDREWFVYEKPQGWPDYYEFRVKPREFPKTSLSYYDLLEAYNKGIDVQYQNRFLQIANAAIKQYILDEEAKK